MEQGSSVKLAKAPGKVVLSGAYVVLQGAPALVAAVDRYAIASSDPSSAQGFSDFVTEEVRAAMDRGRLSQAPRFDASALREQGRKLGLGSSAAILLASLGCQPDVALETSEQLDELFQVALAAHRSAQGGGSGIDVAASTYGGILRYQLPDTVRGTPLDEVPLLNSPPSFSQASLPAGLHFEVWASPHAASTREFLAKVSDAQRKNPDPTARVFSQLHAAAQAAADATNSEASSTISPPSHKTLGDTEPSPAKAEHSAVQFVAALERQYQALSELGRLAEIPICTNDLQRLHDAAQSEGAVLLPAGAGGGDIALFAGLAPPSLELQKACMKEQHQRLALRLGVRGVHQI